jgi:replicative DNA helicase
MSEETRTSVEKAVVGCMLIDSRAIDEFTAHGGAPSWFADSTCRTVAGAICQRYADGRVASDLIAVRQAVGSGVSAMWLDECIDDVPTASQAAYYVGLLKGYAEKDALEGLQRAIAAQVSRCTPETAQDTRGAIESLVNAAMGGGASRETTLAAAGQ